MWNNYDAVRPSRYSDHFGHRAWPFYSKSVEGAVIEDLFWRKVQTDTDFAVAVARTIWPQFECMKGELLLNKTDLRISLWPESCGAYTFGGWCGLYSLRGDATDTKRIGQAEQRIDRGGYYPGPLIAMHKGWLPHNVVPNLMQALGQKLAVPDRFRFNLKAGHRQVLIGTALSKEDVEAIVKMAYPVIYGLSSWTVYWYKTENGNVSHGVVYFYDSVGHVHKLTISAWRPDFPSAAKVVYDLLNIASPYPLYDLDKIVQHRGARYAIIFPSEATVDYIGTDHAWIPKMYPVTTSASIDGTDWTKLRGMTPVIFPEATAWGCHEAFRLHATLEKQRLKPLYIKRQKDEGCGSIKFIQDLGMLAIPHSACRLPEFAEHCQRVFGVEPPAGVLPKAISLASLPEPALPPEVLMADLLDTGEQMMLHAWRGVGKSLFALFLALCFASGKSALNGRVCPSRKYRVLLLDGEMSAQSLKKRARRLCAGHGIPTEAIADVKVRSIIVENKDLSLETDAGFAELEPDMLAADIIVVDSVFKFFPTAMSSDFTRSQRMLGLHEWCRKHGKTLILIDHEGKGRGTSFGTMGKEIALDIVLRLCQGKSPHVIEAHVQKVRDHAEPSGAYLRMRIEADSERIAYQVSDDRKGAAALEGEFLGTAGEAESTESLTGTAMSPLEAIKQFVRENPDKTQAEVVRALQAMGYKQARSTLNGYIKKLADAGELPGWLNGPGSHNAAGQPASEDDED